MGLSDALNRLRIASVEAISYARQASLLHLDTARPVVPQGVVSGDSVVVLLHGLFATAGVLRPLRKGITDEVRHLALPKAMVEGRRGIKREGAGAKDMVAVHTATFTYAPGPDVETLCGQLSDLVNEFPAAVRIHLVGHSLGGIVARAYAQDAADSRVVQTISLASPFAGVPGASVLSFGSVRDLRPDSALLRRLWLSASTSSIPHLSILAGADTVVRPPRAHALPGSDVVVLEDRGHTTLLFDAEVARIVGRRIAKAVLP